MSELLRSSRRPSVSSLGIVRNATANLRKSTINARRRFLTPGPLVQAGKTPFEVIHQEDIVQLRYYPPLAESEIEIGGQRVPVARETYPVPLVLVAPLAVNMLIYDLFPHRSLVKYLRARGFELYLIDWGQPGWRQNHFNLASYFAERMPRLLAEVRRHSGQQKLSLHGWSLGGVFSLCYSALGDPDIVNLSLVGAPCDYHANGLMGKNYQLISHSLRWAEQRMGWRVHATPKRWWRSPGWANALAFKLTNPVGSLQSYLELLRNLHSHEYITANATTAAFLEDMVAYPGAVIQDIIQYLWTDNCMAQGKLPGANLNGHLNQVTANLLMVCGKDDPIVTRDCSLATLRHVRSAERTVLDVAGGHMAILAGSSAPAEIWPQVADWLAARSGKAVQPRRTRRTTRARAATQAPQRKAS